MSAQVDRRRGRRPWAGRRPAGTILLAAIFLAGAVAVATVALRGPDRPETMQERVDAVAANLRCPVCRDLSVADSPSGLARQMRATIAAQLRAGRSPQEIEQGFAEAYGEWILLAPPRRGLNLVAWIAPAVLLLAGLVLAVLAVRRWSWSSPRPASGPGDGAADRLSGSDRLSPSDRRLLERAVAGMPEDDG